MLQRQGRVSYRALKREVELADDYIEDMKEEISKVRGLEINEDGAVLVWMGGSAESEKAKGVNGEKEKDAGPRTPDSGLSAGERRQSTVMFCHLVGSTTLAEQL